MLLVILSACLSFSCLAQQEPPPPGQQSDQEPEQSQAPPRSDTQKARDRDAEAGESSSRDTRIDLSPPKDDAKNHPNSGVVVPESTADTPDAAGDVQETASLESVPRRQGR